MAESLERSRAVEQQFLMSVSHDLRTPLTSIRGYAEAVADGTIADARQAGRVILAESGRLERLVRDLLDLARLQARQFTMQPGRCDLADVAHGVAEGFAPDAADRGLHIVVDAPAPAPVWADPDRLAQMTANLVDNALRYARSMVLVGVRPEPSGAVLVVDDDGPGIAPEDLPHVFERLYVSRRRPARQESGSGLGLAIVRELAEAMGGEVAAETAPTGGARLVVRLPAPLVSAPAAPPPPAR
jgi:two-component system sensor histidine kinase BaeS